MEIGEKVKILKSMDTGNLIQKLHEYEDALVNLLRQAGYLKETDIAELPLTPEIPQQVTMNV